MGTGIVSGIPRATAQPIDPTFQQAMSAYQAGRNQVAIKLFSEIVKRSPKDVRAHYFLGLAYQRVGADKKAIAMFRRILKLDPDYRDADQALGLTLYRLKQYRAAERRFRKILRRDKNDANANFFTGLIRQAAKDHAGAAPYFRRAAASPALAATARFNLGLAYYNLKRFDAARQSFEVVLTLSPEGELATGARQYISLMDSKARNDKRWSMGLEVGRERSNNISRAENDEVTGETDQAWVLGISGDYSFLKSDAWTGTAGYALSQSIYDNISAQNFQSHTATLSFTRELENFEAGLEYSFNHNTLDEQKFLRIHTISPSVSFFPQPTLYTTLGYDFLRKDFFSDRERDGFTNRVAANQFMFFAESKGYILLGLQYELENTFAPQYDLKSVYLNPVLQLPLAWAMTKSGWPSLAALMPRDAQARLGFSYRRKDYTKETASIGEERLDKTRNYGAALSAKILQDLKAEISFSHTDTDSNLVSVVSTENVWALTFSLDF
jgi:tetratricopeptide (TPR) repeat protein